MSGGGEFGLLFWPKVADGVAACPKGRDLVPAYATRASRPQGNPRLESNDHVR
jgi:hypothetical protein